MKRTSTRTTAWPAIADLMTIIVILGVTGLVVFGSDRSDNRCKSIELKLQSHGQALSDCEAVLEQLRDSIAQLQDTVEQLEFKIEALKPELGPPGPSKCWDDIKGQAQLLFRIEIYREHFRIDTVAPKNQLNLDKEIDDLVSTVSPERNYSQKELEDILRRVYRTGRERIDENSRGCRFWGSLELKEDVGGKRQTDLTKFVNRFILTDLPEHDY